VPTAIRRLVDHAFPNPAWVLNRRRDILAWNPAARVLLGDFDEMDDAERNQLRLVFLEPRARTIWADWALVAQDTVALLRDVIATAVSEPCVGELLDDLRTASPDFDALWRRRDGTRACTPSRVVAHPDAGRMSFDVELLDAAGGDLQIVLMEPHAASSESWLDLVRAHSPNRHLRAI